ncbi:MAG TPA: pilus assembly protein TadG-related protein [Gaiellaceae bacterium]|nr:pilus assembly protein TadG-related protein [Gaiellaceae bacterium]
MIARLRSEQGQAFVVMAVFLAVLAGSTAFTIDVGAWYREHRQAQTTADAAALSGAQALPGNTGQAALSAQTYADQNGGTLESPGGITFRSDFAADDTVVVKVTRPTPGFFSSIFGLVTPNVHARAAARSAVPVEVAGAAPIAVQKLHPALSGAACPANNGQPCFNLETTIPLGKNGAPGSFSLVNLDLTSGGATGAKTVADWIANGFSGYLPVGAYLSDPGAKWNDAPIRNAMRDRIQAGSTLLFPVYDTLTGSGQNAQYHVIGWAAFFVESFDASGQDGSVSGQFKQVIWKGIQSSSAPGGPDYGVHSVELVN